MSKTVTLAKPLTIGVLIILLFTIPLFVKGAYTIHIITIALMNVILASSLRLITTSGQFSLGHAGMMSIGAYTSTLLVMKLGFSTWAAIPVGGLAAAAIALAVGYPFSRLKGIYFAMITIFLSEAIRLIIEQWREVTGGTTGIMNIPRPDAITIGGWLTIDFSSRVHYYYFIAIVALVSLVIIYALEHSRIGRVWFSIKQADFLAESIGINTAGYKVLAFSIGCFFAGISGAFYSHYVTVLQPSSFGILLSIYIVIYMVVGGMGNFFGPIIGAIILTFLPEWARTLKEYQPIAFAGVVMLIVFFMPEGLIGLPARLRKLFRRRPSHA